MTPSFIPQMQNTWMSYIHTKTQSSKGGLARSIFTPMVVLDNLGAAIVSIIVFYLLMYKPNLCFLHRVSLHLI